MLIWNRQLFIKSPSRLSVKWYALCPWFTFVGNKKRFSSTIWPCSKTTKMNKKSQKMFGKNLIWTILKSLVQRKSPGKTFVLWKVFFFRKLQQERLLRELDLRNEHECKKNSTARWVVKHLQKLMMKTSNVAIAKKESLSLEQQGLRLRVQSRGFGDGAHIPHSWITKYGKDKYRK